MPEQNEVALLENVGDVNDFLDSVVAHLSWQQQILAENEIAEGKVRDCLQKNQVSDAEVERVRIELVEFQHGEISIEIVGVVLCLLLNVVLEEWEVIRIVAVSFRLLERRKLNSRSLLTVQCFSASQESSSPSHRRF